MIKIGDFETRFRATAIERASISPNELIDALKVQIPEDIEHRHRRLIGEIFLD